MKTDIKYKETTAPIKSIEMTELRCTAPDIELIRDPCDTICVKAGCQTATFAYTDIEQLANNIYKILNIPIGGGAELPEANTEIGDNWNKRNKKWNANAKLNSKAHYLGSFVNETDAAKAYDTFAEKHFGEYAYINLPKEID